MTIEQELKNFINHYGYGETIEALEKVTEELKGVDLCEAIGCGEDE